MITVEQLLQLVGAITTVLSPFVWFALRDAAKRADHLQKRLDECNDRAYLERVKPPE